MKIAVVGCGAVGTFYGARLGRSGQEMHFLLRSDYNVVRRKGVFIRSFEGDFHFNPRCAKKPEDIGVSDLVLIGLKTTANENLAGTLKPLVGPSTAVMTLQNGLGNEELLAKEFGEEKILGGLCFVCLNRIEPGIVQHLAHGNIVMGEYHRWPEPRTHDIASMFRNAGVTCKVAENLECAHWEKLVWNIPFNGLGVAGAAGYEAMASGIVPEGAVPGPCVDTQQLLGDPRWETFVRELMREVIATANALGFKLEDSLVEMHIGRTRRMGPYKASTLLDFEKGLPLEIDTLFLEPLRQARAAGVKAPRLEALCAVLKAVESSRDRQTSAAA